MVNWESLKRTQEKKDDGPRPFLVIDFEFHDTQDSKFPVICCATFDEKTNKEDFFWLDPSGVDLDRFLHELNKWRTSHILMAWSVTAEASSFLSLGIDPHEFLWVDAMVEWKMYRNGRYRYNVPWVGDGPDNLLNATRILLGKEVCKETKDAMRGIILNADLSNPWKDLKESHYLRLVEDYCRGDVKDLIEIYRVIQEKTSGIRKLEDSLASGEYMCSISKMKKKGYLVDFEGLKARTEGYAPDKRAMQDRYRVKIPKLLLPSNKKIETDKSKLLTFKRGVLEAEVNRLAQDYEWALKPLPKPGSVRRQEYDVKLLSFEEACGYSTTSDMLRYAMKVHGIETDIINQHLLDYLEEVERFKFFSPAKKVKGVSTKHWYDFLGKDGQMRPYFNPYGSSTMRNYPSAKGFFPANHSFVCSHMKIPEGKFLVEMDYGQQEFLINGILSGDTAMIDDYVTGDPYVALAKRSGKWDGKKVTRYLFKQTVLGLGFGLTPFRFMWKLRLDSQSPIDMETSDFLYSSYWDNYSVYRRYRDELQGEFEKEGVIRLHDGTTLYHSKAASPLSFLNFPTQGTGGVVLRRSVNQGLRRGLDIRFPFHDANYFQCPQERVYDDIYKAIEVMQEAWHWVFPDAPDIKIEATIYGKGEVFTEAFDIPVETKERYLGRAS